MSEGGSAAEQSRPPRSWVRRVLAIGVLLAAIFASPIGAIGAVETVDPRLLGHLGVQPTPTATPSPLPSPTSTPRPAPLSLPAGNDWSQYRFDVAGTGANPESQLTSSDVGNLAIRWHVGPDAAFESTPAIVNGVVYVTNSNSLYAYTLQDGALLWRFDAIPQQIATVSSSVIVDLTLHLAFYGNPDARLYAVDIRTGEDLWSVLLSNQPGAFIWSSPLVINGKVYVGVASHNDDPCVRGAVYALDEQTSVLDWTHYTVPIGLSAERSGRRSAPIRHCTS